MTVCDVKWLKAVDGHPVGRVVTGVQRDALVDKWERMGLVEVIPVDAPDAGPASAPKTRETGPVAVVQGEMGDECQAPPERAAKAVWRRFLDSRDIPYPRSATKNDLIRAWQEHDDG